MKSTNTQKSSGATSAAASDPTPDVAEKISERIAENTAAESAEKPAAETAAESTAEFTDESAEKSVGKSAVSSKLLRLAAGASLAAGLIHYAVIPEHRAEWWLAAAFFTVLAAFEIIWAALVWTDDRPGVLWLGALINAATVALWAVSRSSGLPFGPNSGEAEGIGTLDVLSTLAEVAVLVALLIALRSGLAKRAEPEKA